MLSPSAMDGYRRAKINNLGLASSVLFFRKILMDSVVCRDSTTCRDVTWRLGDARGLTCAGESRTESGVPGRIDIVFCSDLTS